MHLPYPFQQQGNDLIINLLVSAGSSISQVSGWHMGRLKLRVQPAPEKGKANEAVVELLARRLRICRSRIHILKGHHSRLKQVLIQDIPIEALQIAFPFDI